jgi:hypothetical protein
MSALTVCMNSVAEQKRPKITQLILRIFSLKDFEKKEAF